MDDNPYRGSRFDAGGRWLRGPIAAVLKLLAVVVVVGLLILFFLPAVRAPRTPNRRNTCANHLHIIAMALRNYAYVYHTLPPAHTVDADGKPLHSWRTLILPFIEYKDLYDTIDLAKPWNDPANAKACNTALGVYRCPSNINADRLNETTYLAIVGPECCFLSDKPRELAEITDMEAETLMVIEVDAAHAVPWMAPVDADERLVLGIGHESKSAHPGGMQAALVDGGYRFLAEDMPAAQRRALMTIAGNDDARLDEDGR